MKNILKHNNLYLLPFIIILSYPFIYDTILTNTSRYYLALIITIIAPLLIKNIFNIKPFLFVLISFPVLIVSLTYNIQISEYGTYVNLSTWPTILNSNANESKEFFLSLRSTTLITIFIQIATYIFYFIYLKNKKEKNVINIKQKYLFLGIGAILIIDIVFQGATEIILPYRSVATFVEYMYIKKSEAKYLKIKQNTSFNSYRNDTTFYKQKETIVIVVGEALRRDHLQYYGYNRKTTPLLNKENLIIYTDVVSPANQTLNSLKRVFTLAEGTDETPYWKYPSFIKIFKELNYKTYWITSQPQYGDNETETSYLGKETNCFIPITNSKYDNEIFEDYNKVLNNNDLKKLIIIHLKGNHAKYSERYPDSFNVFAKTLNKNADINIINEYDNSVRYNDYILSKILNNLKQVKGEKSFIMFSDHGESLYDTSPTMFTHGSENPAQSELNIPLIVWLSKEFKSKHNNKVKHLNSNTEKAIILSDFFHSIPSLYGIKFDMYNENKNFFGRSYISKKHRYIMNVNYEMLMYEKLNSKIKYHIY